MLPRAARRALRAVPGATAVRARLQRRELERLRRLSPVSRAFGLDRGTAVDRIFIERFLAANARSIRGAVLEVGDDGYTRRFGSAVARSEVLHVEGAPGATIVGNFATGENVPRDAFDCMIVTQVLPFVYDVHAAVRTIHAALRPGGVVLATVPGISQISREDMERWGDYWRFTSASTSRLFGDVFDRVSVAAHGNVLLAASFLYGFSAEEVGAHAFEVDDPDYELLITVRAVRAPAADSPRP